MVYPRERILVQLFRKACVNGINQMVVIFASGKIVVYSKDVFNNC